MKSVLRKLFWPGVILRRQWLGDPSPVFVSIKDTFWIPSASRRVVEHEAGDMVTK